MPVGTLLDVSARLSESSHRYERNAIQFAANRDRLQVHIHLSAGGSRIPSASRDSRVSGGLTSTATCVPFGARRLHLWHERIWGSIRNFNFSLSVVGELRMIFSMLDWLQVGHAKLTV